MVGTLGAASCPGTYAVGGCGGSTGDGVNGQSENNGVMGTSSHASGGTTAAAVLANNTGGGDIFLGEANGTHVARIDSAGKGFFDGGTQASGADYAESIQAVGGSQLSPGDVLAIAPAHGYAGRRFAPAVLTAGRRRLLDQAGSAGRRRPVRQWVTVREGPGGDDGCGTDQGDRRGRRDPRR